MALVSVVGATGRQGLAQIRQLVAAGHSVRALSRNENPDLGPTNADIETRVIDLYDRATYVKALEGSDAVFYNHPLQLRDSRAELAGWIGEAAKDMAHQAGEKAKDVGERVAQEAKVIGEKAAHEAKEIGGKTLDAAKVKAGQAYEAAKEGTEKAVDAAREAAAVAARKTAEAANKAADSLKPKQ